MSSLYTLERVSEFKLRPHVGSKMVGGNENNNNGIMPSAAAEAAGAVAGWTTHILAEIESFGVFSRNCTFHPRN